MRFSFDFVLGLILGPLLFLFCLIMLIQIAVTVTPYLDDLQNDTENIQSFGNELGWRLTSSPSQENLYVNYSEIPKEITYEYINDDIESVSGKWYSDDSYVTLLRDDGSEEKIPVVANYTEKTWGKDLVARNTWDFDPGFKVVLPLDIDDIGRIVKIKAYMTCTYPKYLGNNSYQDETVLFTSEHNIMVISQQDYETIAASKKLSGRKQGGPVITVGLLIGLFFTVYFVRKYCIKKS